MVVGEKRHIPVGIPRPKVVTFPRCHKKNEADSRIQKKGRCKTEEEESSKTYNIDYIFLKGGKIFQVPPTEVVASGGHWGSGGQDQQSSGHKVKLHSSVGQKSIQVAIFDECDVIGGGAES